MNNVTASPSPTTPPESERDDESPSPEFASALADYERDKPHTEVAAAAAADPVPGTKVRGTVIRVGDDNVLVDFGGRSEGAVETRFFRGEDGSVRVGVGDVLDLYVVGAGDQVTLAPSVRVEAKDALKHVREAHTAGVPVSGKVTAVNAGGLTIDLGGVRGFCPMSQIELGFCSDASKYVGKALEFVVTSIEEGRGSAVVSRRQLLKAQGAETAKQVLATLKPGDECLGTVVRLEPFGAFVDLGGVDGMVHVSEIRHERTGHPNQVLSEGQKVNVRITRIDAGKDGRPRIALSMKAVAPDPWAGVEQQFAAGSRVQGKVARLTDFGAFVTLAPGIDGLVHVSEIAYERVAHPKDKLHVGEDVEALVLGVDPAKKRVSLSIKRTLDAPEGWTPPPERSSERGERAERGPRGGGPRGERGERGDRGPRGERGDRGPRSERGERGPRGDRGDRGDRGERGGAGAGPRDPRVARVTELTKPSGPEEPTTMAIALRKALEEAKKREQGTS